MPDPNIPEHTIEPDGPGRLVVRVGSDIVGHVSEDAEHPGLWVVEDKNGQFMGREYQPEKGAEFLAAWFVSEDENWT